MEIENEMDATRGLVLDLGPVAESFRRVCAGNLREQGRQQGGQAAGGRRQDQLPQEVQARHLSGQGGWQQRQSSRGRRQEKLHAEVPARGLDRGEGGASCSAFLPRRALTPFRRSEY